MLAAAELALKSGHTTGSLSSGQHHAKRATGDGFCTFNGIALAARRAVRSCANRILVIGTDAYCAGGTHSLIENDDRICQADISVNSFDSYAPRPPNTLDYVRFASEYLRTLNNRLKSLQNADEHFDLCIYYAGIDPYERCHIGGRLGIDRTVLTGQEALVFEWCCEQGIPVAFGIGGRYTNAGFQRGELVELHRLTLGAAVDYNITAAHASNR
jgi:acetoin utilization deacetylase AcuC-like enzyme